MNSQAGTDLFHPLGSGTLGCFGQDKVLCTIGVPGVEKLGQDDELRAASGGLRYQVFGACQSSSQWRGCSLQSSSGKGDSSFHSLLLMHEHKKDCRLQVICFLWLVGFFIFRSMPASLQTQQV